MSHRSIAPPPHNIEAEQALLGAVLVNNDAWWRVCDRIAEEHFYDMLHGRIFAAMAQMMAAGRRVTPITLQERFGATDLAVEVAPGMSALQYFGVLAKNATSIINAPDYADTVVEMALRRALLNLGEGLSAAAYDPPPDQSGRDMVEQAERVLHDLAERGRTENCISAMDAVQAAIREGKPPGCTWGLASLDHDTGGLRRGEYAVIAGRPSMGKSIVATHMAKAQAQAGLGVQLFSIEMMDEVVGSRLLSERAWERGVPVPYHMILTDRVPEEKWPDLSAVARDFAELPLAIVTDSGITVHDIRARARRLKRRWAREGRSLDVVIVDYLGMIRAAGTYRGNKVEETEEISAGLKELAKELDVAVVALVQLSRQVEARADKRPMLSDLRWSGAIEQDADVVLFLFREAYYLERMRETDTDAEVARLDKVSQLKHTLEIIIGKQRNGPCHSIEVHIDAANSAISDRHHIGEAA